MSNQWPRRFDFVNMVLAWGVPYGYVKIKDVEFDGIAGKQFDRAIDDERNDFTIHEKNELINMALKLGVPVEGLVADGDFGPKWAEVIALAKETDAFDPMIEAAARPGT